MVIAQEKGFDVPNLALGRNFGTLHPEEATAKPFAV